MQSDATSALLFLQTAVSAPPSWLLLRFQWFLQSSTFLLSSDAICFQGACLQTAELLLLLCRPGRAKGGWARNAPSLHPPVRRWTGRGGWLRRSCSPAAPEHSWLRLVVKLPAALWGGWPGTCRHGAPRPRRAKGHERGCSRSRTSKHCAYRYIRNIQK
jgi:hypothetical protein